MSALKLDNAEQRVRAEDAVEIIDCGRADPGIPVFFDGSRGRVATLGLGLGLVNNAS
jgi:hypothetical protein